MFNIRQWLDGLHFSTPIYFDFIYFIYAMAALLFATLAMKFIFRPRKSKYSRYLLLAKDSIWVLLIILCVLGMVALAGPRVAGGYTLSQGGGVDVIVWIDDSFSMKAGDIKPSRQEAAKRAAIELTNGLKSGDRITLFVFGDNTRWRMPLSHDLNDFVSKVEAIDHPAIYEEESQLNTNFPNAIEYASRGLDKQDRFAKNNLLGIDSAGHNKRVGIFFSDGNNEMDDNLAPGINELRRRNIKVYTVGIGTIAGTEVEVLTHDPNNPSGPPPKNRIKTSLSVEDLKAIASGTGGEAFVLNSGDQHRQLMNFLKNAVDSNRSILPRLVYSDDGRDVWWEILSIPAIALLLLALWRR